MKKVINLLSVARNKFHLFFIGKEFLEKQKKLESQIEFMSTIISEQSRLIASVALVQSDLATAVKNYQSLDTGEEYFTLRIPLDKESPPN